MSIHLMKIIIMIIIIEGPIVFQMHSATTV